MLKEPKNPVTVGYLSVERSKNLLTHSLKSILATLLANCSFSDFVFSAEVGRHDTDGTQQEDAAGSFSSAVPQHEDSSPPLFLSL
jgi:hypothetical protein